MTSADITKLAGIYFFEEMEKRNLLFKVKMPNVVHDEWIVEAPESMAEEIADLLQECMEKAGDVFCKIIKLKADPCITLYWKH